MKWVNMELIALERQKIRQMAYQSLINMVNNNCDDVEFSNLKHIKSIDYKDEFSIILGEDEDEEGCQFEFKILVYSEGGCLGKYSLRIDMASNFLDEYFVFY